MKQHYIYFRGMEVRHLWIHPQRLRWADQIMSWLGFSRCRQQELL